MKLNLNIIKTVGGILYKGDPQALIESFHNKSVYNVNRQQNQVALRSDDIMAFAVCKSVVADQEIPNSYLQQHAPDLMVIKQNESSQRRSGEQNREQGLIELSKMTSSELQEANIKFAQSYGDFDTEAWDLAIEKGRAKQNAKRVAKED